MAVVTLAVMAEMCCGQPMNYQEIFGVRRYQCAHRPRHDAIWVNLGAGERAMDKDVPVVLADRGEGRC